MNDIIKEKLNLLPTQSGCYLMKDDNNKIIYVGKAKNLRNRVKSYFTGSHDLKTTKLVSLIHDFEYIITPSELDALIMEINLIKEHNPRFNIMLKDDKSYPYIEITKELHPKLVITRKITKKSGKLFGPYPNVSAARDTVSLLDKIYPLRKCSLLPKNECLYYHIGQCLAPCINKVEQVQYDEIISEVSKFLKGNTSNVLNTLKNKMIEASEKLEFERANEYKKLIDSVNTTTYNQKVMINDLVDRDVFGYYYDDNYACVEVFYIRQGKIIATENRIFSYYGEILESITEYIAQFYNNKIKPKEIFIPSGIDQSLLEDYLKIKVFEPKKGLKKKIIESANKNAENALSEKLELFIRKQSKTLIACKDLGEILNLRNTPYNIEAFDNSNTGGEDIVSGMVSFINGEPNKKGYRKFKLKTVNNSDDFNAMKEVIYRRYLSVLMDDLVKPDLIIVDGGKIQVKAALEVLTSLNMIIPVIGLKKDDKHRTESIINGIDNTEVKIDKHSNIFYLLSKIQEEVHRFTISYHRNVRSKNLLATELREIDGVGHVREVELLKHFGSISNIMNASLEDIMALNIPENIAKKIKEKFSS